MTKEIEKTIIDTICGKSSPYLIMLFGSAASGSMHNDSDIDIAFLSDKIEFDTYELCMISQELAAKIDRDVDLINLNKASKVFQAQIVHTGKPIYCTDEQKNCI